VSDLPTVEQDQPMSQQSYAPTDYAPTPPAPKRRSSRAIFVGVLVLIAAVVGAFVLVGRNPSTPQATIAPPPLAEGNAIAATGEVKPAITDFKLTPKVIDRECFGSASCNVTLRVDMELKKMPAPGTTWLVVYEIHGVKDGPLVGSLTLTGTQYEASEQDVQTTSAKSKLTVKVVSVDKA
jgi:hypothetical protein